MTRLSALVPFAAAIGAVPALAVPAGPPTYSFCEEECLLDGPAPRGLAASCNDTCVDPQILDASLAVALAGDESVRDCFYVTGKLDADCVWAVEPKCHVRAYDKPVPCRDATGAVIPGRFYEPLLGAAGANGVIAGLPVLSDRTVRLAVGAFSDAFDGTVNGLVNNGPHYEHGLAIVEVYHGGRTPGAAPDQTYAFDFASGADALRVAFVIPPGVSTVDIVCAGDTGQAPVGWDVDHFLVRNLLPGRFYAVEFVGGEFDADALPYLPFLRADERGTGAASKTPVTLGWFDKNCNLLQCATPAGGDGPRLIATAEVDGTLRIAVSGAAQPRPLAAAASGASPTGDCNFNGLEDAVEPWLNEFLFRLRVLEGLDYVITGGASLKDATAALVNRFPRHIWDGYFEWNAAFHQHAYFSAIPPAPLEAVVGHGVVGGYCLKVTLAEHVPAGDRPAFPTVQVINAARNDMNRDGVVDAADIALVLSYWGPVPR